MSVYISNLPLYTGNTYNGYIIWNDSGETTTYKTLFQPPFKVVGTNNSNNIYDTTTMSGTYNAIVGGYNHNFSSGSYSSIAGGFEHTTPYDFNYSFAGGGYQHQLGGTSNAFIGGTSNAALNNIVTKTAFIAGQGNSAHGGDRCAFIGGYSNFMYGPEDSFMLGGYDNFLLYSNQSGIVGGIANSIRLDFGTKSNGILYGENNQIKGQVESDSAKNYNTIINGLNNTISGASSYYNTISNGINNGIDDGYNTQIIAGSGNTISGKSNVVMLGCNNRTATRNDATFVENLVVFNYAGLNFLNDTAAAAGGVVLGQVYHNAGALRIRIV